MATNEKIKDECPDCGKKGVLLQIIAHRKSFTPKSVKYFCNNTFKKANGAVETCGFKAHIRLNRGEYDWVGEVKSY